MPKPLPSPELLRKLLRYDPETGRLFWRERTADMFNPGATLSAERISKSWNNKHAGNEAVNNNHEGYRRGVINGKPYYSHRVIWAMYTGFWPVEQIDHENGIRHDNRIGNLREATNMENSINQKLRSTNTSGTSGVSWSKGMGKWLSRISSAGRIVHLGYFHDMSAAISARKNAEIKYGYHPNHGRDLG